MRSRGKPGARYDDAAIAAALATRSGNVTAAARSLGLSPAGLRAHVFRVPELYALARKRPGIHKTLVTDEEIVLALQRFGVEQRAARFLGVPSAVIANRSSDAVQAERAKIQRRYHGERRERWEERRKEVAERLAILEQRKALVVELTSAWHFARDSWIMTAFERGLSQAEMGEILGVTRQRVQQLESSLGLSRNG